jgi:glutathione synthase/RimK-type ligase-like ATP-grasp enzyme
LKVAIVDIKKSYSEGWIKYLEENSIEYDAVNPYEHNIVSKLLRYDLFLWHFDHFNHKDALCAKSIIYSLNGKVKTFPNLDECIYFDDKLSQKYLLEALHIDIPKTYVFFEKEKALKFTSNTEYPFVAKLRKGAGSGNVWLIKNKSEATKFINKAFGNGFSVFNAKKYIQKRIINRDGEKSSVIESFKGFYRMRKNKRSAEMHQKEIGYVLFQEYLNNPGYDIRALVINYNKVFFVRRSIPSHNWSASGVGELLPSMENVDPSFVQHALELSKKAKSRCLAIDYIMDVNHKKYKVLEVSTFYSYKPMNDVIFGYWDESLKWHEERTDPQEFLIDSLITL